MYSHIILITGARTWQWTDLIERAFNDAWREWGPSRVTAPLLVSGHCPNGADRLAEAAWDKAGFGPETKRLVSADWASFGSSAGMRRNEAMVDFVAGQVADTGAEALVVACFSLCAKNDCRYASQQQLWPQTPGHFSHGTSHCWSAAESAGLKRRAIIDPRLPPF